MSSLNIEIDPSSGFCFGVVKAIETVENELNKNGIIHCLGDIVHNNMEMNRLTNKGMISINKDEIDKIKSNNIFIRAHGEPPETYKLAKSRGLSIIDATCPVVLKLQSRIKKSWEYLKPINGQIIIYGKKGHAEVIGLMGQTNNEAFIIESLDEVTAIDLNKPTHFYAQTTKSIDVFKEISDYLSKNIKKGVEFKSFDTICRQVASRLPKITAFAQKHELIVFVGGEKSSNAQMLFNQCKKTNEQSYFVSNNSQIDPDWFTVLPKSVGICGATSTPPWLMQQIAEEIEKITKDK